MKLQRYDKLLFVKKHLNGIREVKRKSPFKHKDYSIIKVVNRIFGSGIHIIKELYKQDAQRTKIIQKRIKQNLKVGKFNNSAMHKELSNFIINNEKL
jgi:hypothetical protein